MGKDTENERELTRRDLAEALEKSNALVESQTAALSTQAANIRKLELMVEALLKQAPSIAEEVIAPPVFEPKLVPYKGLARALTTCCVGLNGDGVQTRYEKGQVFDVDVTALWTDDPFEAVYIARYEDEDRQIPVFERNQAAPTPINFQFRKPASQAIDMTPRQAGAY